MNNLIKAIMAKLNTKRFVPTPEEAQQGVQAMDKTEILESLMRYKAQNPVKYTAKKEALFAKYGLDLNNEPVELKDEEEVELEAIKASVTKKAKAK